MKQKFLLQSKVPVLWKLENINVLWKEDTCVGQSKFDKWNIDAPDTDFLDKLYEDWGIDPQCTRHYYSSTIQLDFEFEEICKFIPGKEHVCSMLKLTPGHCIPWHYDTFRSYVLQKNVSQNLQRTIIMLEDWKIGQVIQFGKEIIGHWKAGDTYTWNHNLWHGAANFGNRDLIVMMISYQF